jgi:hypothetical protein
MSYKPNHDIMKRNVIDREELIEYLTWIVENDGELEKFYYREGWKTNDDDLVPDVEAFRDWLKGQDFDNMIRQSYFEEYIKNYFQNAGEYDPNSLLSEYIDWEDICNELINNNYHAIFDWEEYHPKNIFGEEFYYEE